MTFAQVQNGSAITGSTAGGVTTLALTLPAGSTAGTLLVACMVTGQSGTPMKIASVQPNGNPNTSPGWEWCCTSVNGSGTGGQQIEIWCYRKNPGGITGTTWTNATAQGARGHMMEFSSTAAYQVMELFPGLNTAVTAGATSFPVAMTTPTASAELAVSMFGDNFSVSTSLTWTTPTGWTLGKSTTTGGTIQMHWASYWQATTSAGAVSVTGVASTSTNQVGWEAAVVVFRETAAVRSRVGASCSPGTYTDQASFGLPPTKTGSAKEFDTFVGRPMSVMAQTSYQQEGAHLTSGPTGDLNELTAMGAQIFWSLKPRRTGLSGFTSVADEQAAVDTDLALVKQAGITGFLCGIYNEFQLGGQNGPFGNDTFKGGPDPYGTGNTDTTAKNHWLAYWANYQPILAAHGIPAFTVPSLSSAKAASSWQPPAGTVSGVMAHYYFDVANGQQVALDVSPGTGVPALQDVCDGTKNPDNSSATNTPTPMGLTETGRAGGSSTPPFSEVVGWSANGTWTDSGVTKTANGPRKFFAARITANKQNSLVIWFENNINGPNWIHTPGTGGEDQTGIQAELAAWVDNLAPVAAPPVVVTTTSLPNGTLGAAYNQSLQVTGGTPPYTWAVLTGSLPTGLSLSSGGVISGTPTVGNTTSTFTVKATDTNSVIGNSGTLTIFVPGISVTTTSLPAVTTGVAYSQTLTESGGIGPFTWRVTADSVLPAGITLSSAGVLSGTTGDLTGTYAFTAVVTDSLSATASAALSLLVTAGATGGGPPAVPQAGYPQLIVEAGFYAAQPVAQPGALILDDPVSAVFDTGILGDSTAWTDITTFVRSGTVTRASTRVQGPLRTYQAGTGSVVLDNSTGAFDPQNGSSPFAVGGVNSSIRPMVPFRVRAIWANTEYKVFSGFADTWQEDPVDYDAGWSQVTVSGSDGFKILAGATLPADVASGSGETSGGRVTRILNAAQWYTDHRKIDTGDSQVQATTFGDTALGLLQLTADTEIGELYIDGGGFLVFRARQGILTEARSTTPQAVFGDLPGTADAEGTELACAAVGRANDDTQLANDVQITRAGGTLQRAKNQTSINKYLFPRSYARTDVLLESDPEAKTYAQWVLYVSNDPTDRFDTVVIDPIADPAGLFPQVLGREIGDRIMVYRRPQNSGTVISRACIIRGITHAVDVAAGTWQTTWDLENASKYTGFLILDDTTKGKVSSGNKLAY